MRSKSKLAFGPDGRDPGAAWSAGLYAEDGHAQERYHPTAGRQVRGRPAAPVKPKPLSDSVKKALVLSGRASSTRTAAGAKAAVGRANSQKRRDVSKAKGGQGSNRRGQHLHGSAWHLPSRAGNTAKDGEVCQERRPVRSSLSVSASKNSEDR